MIQNEKDLDDSLSDPPAAVVEVMSRLDGDLILLGVAGKMGPTLARMAKRASELAGVKRRVIGVSRFSSNDDLALHEHGIETIRCDLLDDNQVTSLPDVPNVLFLAGRKFGSNADQAATWAINSYLPGAVCRKYKTSRIVAFSTGNVYGLTRVSDGGSREEDSLNPLGEYAMSCLGRERVFEHFSRAFNIKLALIRLNYACELRYGVLVDLAQQVWAGNEIDLSMGYFNVIWQGDANAMTLRAFEYCSVPPKVLNVTGPELMSVRTVCQQMGLLMNRPVRFVGTESETALLNDARRSLELLGPPRVNADKLIQWVTDWVAKGGATLSKPTHFGQRDGRF